MKVNHTSLSHLLALLALFTLVYIIYQTSPTVNFSPKHKHRLLKTRTIIIADRPINKLTNQNLQINNKSPADQVASSKKTKFPPQTLQNISDCLCSRNWMYGPPTNYSQRLNSSCSDEGTHYQPLQKVISFSMRLPPNASSPSSYSKGLLQNLLKMRRHYPGYSLRLYTPLPPFCSLLCQNPDLFWCAIRITPSHTDLHFRFWKYLPLGDPTVRIFHSRDLTSLLSYREAAAVQHWLSEDKHKAIMVMRDRNGGHDAPILGNMWGADNTKLGWKKGGVLREQIWKATRDSGAADQLILEKVIFYPMARHVVAYDAYHCKKMGRFTEVRAFPTQRQDPFTDVVQNKVEFGPGNNWRKWNLTAEKCPVECRPDYGKDWIYC